jgi:hypothetical protein
VGQLLGQRAAEGDAEHVEPPVPERTGQLVHRAREPGHPPGQPVPAGAAGTGRVDGDGLYRARVEGLLERRPHLDVAADAHQQQQRPAGTADRDPQPDPVDVDVPQIAPLPTRTRPHR